MITGIFIFYVVFLLPMIRLLLIRFIHVKSDPKEVRRRFKGKTVFITGGTSGVGKSLVQEMIAGGANVILVGRDEKKVKYSFIPELISSLDDKTKMTFFYDRSELDDTVVDIQNGSWDSSGNFNSKSLLFFKCELRDLEMTKGLSARLASRNIQIDYLFYFAGINHPIEHAINSKTPSDSLKVRFISILILSETLLPLLSKEFSIFIPHFNCFMKDNCKTKQRNLTNIINKTKEEIRPRTVSSDSLLQTFVHKINRKEGSEEDVKGSSRKTRYMVVPNTYSPRLYENSNLFVKVIYSLFIRMLFWSVLPHFSDSCHIILSSIISPSSSLNVQPQLNRSDSMKEEELLLQELESNYSKTRWSVVR